MPFNRRSRHDIDRGRARERDIVVGCDRIYEYLEFKYFFAIGLEPDAARPLPLVTEADRNCVARLKEVFDDANIERPAPGANIALELPAAIQHRAI